MSVTIAIANPKGGTAKTSTSVNLAAALSLTGRRVLLCDLDAQGSATVSLDIKRLDECALTRALVENRPLTEHRVVKAQRFALDLLPAGDDLNALPALLRSQKDYKLRFKTALSKLAQAYDYVLLDCPPGLGLMTKEALGASDFLIIPTHCEMMSLASAASLIEMAAKLKDEGLTEVKILGMLITMLDPETGSETFKKTCEALKDFGLRVFNTVIPYSLRISEAQASGAPIIYYDRSSLGARAYLTLAGEVLTLLNELNA